MELGQRAVERNLVLIFLGAENSNALLEVVFGASIGKHCLLYTSPTIGLHPLDVQVLLSVFDGLVAKGATVIVIEHDLDLICNADYVIDMGPGGGDAGGQIVCAGTPADIVACSKSITGRYL